MILQPPRGRPDRGVAVARRRTAELVRHALHRLDLALPERAQHRLQPLRELAHEHLYELGHLRVAGELAPQRRGWLSAFIAHGGLPGPRSARMRLAFRMPARNRVGTFPANVTGGSLSPNPRIRPLWDLVQRPGRTSSRQSTASSVMALPWHWICVRGSISTRFQPLWPTFTPLASRHENWYCRRIRLSAVDRIGTITESGLPSDGGRSTMASNPATRYRWSTWLSSTIATFG